MPFPRLKLLPQLDNRLFLGILNRCEHGVTPTKVYTNVQYSSSAAESVQFSSPQHDRNRAMCGRFTQRTRLNEWLRFYSLESQLHWEPRFNIAPSQPVLAIRHDPLGDHQELATLRWGLIPSWTDDISMGNRLINARAETLITKPSFQSALKSRRCLVIADGFYEWKKSGKNKQPYFIQMADERPFVFAGLWDRWAKSSPAIESCTIITTTPNALVADIHDRMPVILAEAAATLWLDRTVEDAESLTSLLVPYPDSEMVAYPVSPLVNSPQHDSADCIAPIQGLF
jgi:putative SOS response-associated peptidase YedK